MAKVIANLTLDTYQRNRLLPLIVPQGDYGAREVHARITSNGNFVKIEKTDAVSIIATRTGDGESLAFSGIINDDGSVNVPITQWMLDIPESEVKCHIEITGNGYEYSTNEFLIEPQEKSNPTEITEDDPRVDVVTEVLANENARQVAESIRTQNENLRIDAENLRNIAEEQRLIDEDKRIENETQRISAENYRDITFKNWSSEIALLPNMSDRISRNDKRITNLEQGLVPSPFVTDDSVAYIKDVPLNALPFAEVSKVGGMTYKDGGTLKSAKPTALKIIGANLFNDIKWFTDWNFAPQSDGSWLGRSLNTTCFTNTSRRSGSMYFSVVAKTEATQKPFYLHIYYTNGSQAVACDLTATSDFVTFSGYTDPSKTVDRVIWTYSSGGEYYIKGVSMSFVDGGGYIPYAETSFPIPTEVQALDGYGEGLSADCHNYIDWDKKQFVKRVGKVNLGALNWQYSYDIFKAEISDIKPNTINLLSEIYIVSPVQSGAEAPDMSMYGCSPFNAGIGGIAIKNSDYTDATNFKSAMYGVILYYELAEPIITDISNLISVDNYIGVEGGGTITAVNEYEYAVPTEITYQIKGAAV